MDANGSEAAETLQRAGAFAGAERAYRSALAVAPDDARTLGNLGGLLNQLCRFDEAEASSRRAVALDPRDHGAWSNLGVTMVEQQRFADAVAAFGNALAIRPDHGPALANMGVALHGMGQPALALRFLDMAVALAPDHAETRCNRALALLASGDYPTGFAEYEWRWRTAGMVPHAPGVPAWNGDPRRGETLLIHAEGGFGDVLQFARFVPLARARFAGRVVLQVPDALRRLLARQGWTDAVIGSEDPVPPHDRQCSVLGLAHALGVSVRSVPGSHGYLAAEPALLLRWRRWLDDEARGSGPRIGLVWAGAPREEFRGAALTDRRRSMALAALAPLWAALPHATFVSVQIGVARREAHAPPPGLRLLDPTPFLHDFEETAALCAALDHVVAVDTSTAHLAAALGRPVSLLSRYDQCWRWLVGRTDSPWYRSLTVWQQPVPFDWATPVDALARSLARRRASHVDGPDDGRGRLARGAARPALHSSGVSTRSPAYSTPFDCLTPASTRSDTRPSGSVSTMRVRVGS